MKMKKIYLYLSVAVALTFTSCNEWLDIQPELEMRQTTMFESEQGFKDVLTGALRAQHDDETAGNDGPALDDTICQFDTGRDLSYQ